MCGESEGFKNWILPKEINANRSSETLIGWKSGKKHLYPSMGSNGGRVAIDSG
jgi:hypothetical protein